VFKKMTAPQRLFTEYMTESAAGKRVVIISGPANRLRSTFAISTVLMKESVKRVIVVSDQKPRLAAYLEKMDMLLAGIPEHKRPRILDSFINYKKSVYKRGDSLVSLKSPPLFLAMPQLERERGLNIIIDVHQKSSFSRENSR